MVGADHVERDEGEPVYGVDAVGEEDEPRLIEPARTFPGLEGVESGRDDEEEGEEEARHEARVHAWQGTSHSALSDGTDLSRRGSEHLPGRCAW